MSQQCNYHKLHVIELDAPPGAEKNLVEKEEKHKKSFQLTEKVN